MDEEQNVQMHGGGHMRKTWRGLFGLKMQVGVGESGRLECRGAHLAAVSC